MRSFKESGAIEYSSDVLIGLQLCDQISGVASVDTAKRAKDRKVGLKIIKNRNGQTGDYILYSFTPRINCFREIEIAKKTDIDKFKEMQEKTKKGKK